MIASFRKHQSKMTAENMRSALAFAVFTFLLVLIATFGVVYRYDMYPGYGTLVHIGLYPSPNISSAAVKSDKSIENSRGQEPLKTTAPTPRTGNSDEFNKSSEDFLDEVLAIFASVKRPSEPHTTTIATTERVEFPGQEVHDLGDLRTTATKTKSHSGDGPVRATPEKFHEADSPQRSTTAHPNRPVGKSYYDRLIDMVSKDLEPVQPRTEQISGPPPKTQAFPPWIEAMFRNPPKQDVDPRTTSLVFSRLEDLFEGLDEELSSEYVDLPEFPFASLLDDGISFEVTEESDSDEGVFFFGRNPKHFEHTERLPQFPHPVVDFPLNRNFHP